MRARTVLGERSAVLASREIRPGVVLAESLLLALGGGAIGAALTALVLPALRDITPAVIPRLSEVAFDARVVAFTVVLVVLVTLAVGILPALRASRTDTATKGWLGAMTLVALVAVQVALAFVLIAATGLAMRAVGDLRGRDVGINPAGLLSADVYLPRDPYVTRNVSGTGSAEIAEFSPAGAAVYDRIRAALQTTPGVVQAAGVGTHPFASNPFVQFWIGDLEHTPENRVAAQYLAVTENYFNTVGVRVVSGRDFSAADRPDSPWVVLVNETLAKQQWPDSDPIGQQLTLTFSPNDEEPAREVVGLVADTIPFRGASEVPPLIYVLHRQQATQQRASLEGRRTVMSFIVRTAGDPLALGDAVRAQVGKVDATTPVASIRTVESYLNAGQTALLQYGETLARHFRARRTGRECRGRLRPHGLRRRPSSIGARARPLRRGGGRHRSGGGLGRLDAARRRHRVVSHEPHDHAVRSHAARRHGRHNPGDCARRFFRRASRRGAASDDGGPLRHMSRYNHSARYF